MSDNSPQSPSWYRIAATNYVTVQLCLTLEDIGLFDELRKGPTTVTKLSDILRLRRELLDPCLEFLSVATDFFKKGQDEIAFARSDFPKAWILAAYKPVFDDLADLLRGKKVYGRDVVRNGFYLQKASTIFSGDAVRRVLAVLDRDPAIDILVDLGCGSGETLVAYCAVTPQRRGIGIDIDQQAVNAARANVARAKLADRIIIVEADIANIDAWRKTIPDGHRVAFLASTVLHEFFRNGEKIVADYLSSLHAIPTASRLFLIEFDALSFERIQNEPDEERKLLAAMYQLWHPLTMQGMPQPRRTWEHVLVSAGWRINDVIPAENNLLVYECRI